MLNRKLYTYLVSIFPFTVYWFSGIGMSLLGWMYNIIASWMLSLTDFSHIALLLTFHAIVAVFYTALVISVAHYSAVSTEKDTLSTPLQSLALGTIFLSFLIGVIYIIFSPWWKQLFQFSASLEFLFVTLPLFITTLPVAWYRGILLGNEAYIKMGINILFEGIVKVSFALIVVSMGFSSVEWLGFALSLGSIAAFIWFTIDTKYFYPFLQSFRLIHKKISIPMDVLHFYLQALFLNLGISLVLSIDLLFVKHFFFGEIAGIYSLLNLVGKVIFFSAVSFTGLIVPIISNRLHNPSDQQKAFRIIWGLVTGVSVSIWLLFVFFPQYTLQLLIQDRFKLVEQYIPIYGLGVVFLSIFMAISFYKLVLKEYIYSTFVMVALFLEVLLMVIFHDSLNQIILSLLIVTLLLAVVSICLLIKPDLFSKLVKRKA